MKKFLLFLSIVVLSVLNSTAQQTTFLETYVEEDFNAGILPANWTNSAITGSYDWRFGIDGAFNPGEGGEGINNLDGTNMVYFDDDSLGAGAAFENNTPSLESPSFDNSAPSVTFLEFDFNFKTARQFGVQDSLYIEVYDGTNWQWAWSVKEDSCGFYKKPIGFTDCQTDGFFPHAKVDISAFSNANCKVRFVYHDGNAGINDYAYYAAIDNVEIYSPQETDLSVGKVINPISDCGLTDSEIVQLEIFNTGVKLATNFNVTVEIDTGTKTITITETFTDTIFPQGQGTHTFATTGNFLEAKRYQIVAYTSLAADTLLSNDTNITNIINQSVYDSPYFDGFEGLETDWIVSGDSAQWERGFPAGNFISSSRQGSRAWVTKLEADYSDFDFYNGITGGSILTSPCLDFSVALGDPVVLFQLQRQIEGGDRLLMQTSINDGQTWQNIPNTPVSRNWYNNSPRDGWDGTSGYVQVENVLRGLGGEPAARVRFIFSSDSPGPIPTRSDGAAIDAFQIIAPDSINLGVRTLNYPLASISPECGYGIEEIDINLENRGVTDLDSVVVAYQVDNNPIVRDTILSLFKSNTLLNHKFSQFADFSEQGKTYNLSVWVEADFDGTRSNDSILNERIFNPVTNLRISPYRQNFDDWRAGTTPSNEDSQLGDEWIRSNPTTWQIASSNANTTPMTGPAANHTPGNPNGNFAYIETSQGDSGSFAVLETPCLDFSQKSAVQLDFWYFRYGGSMSNLIIEVFDGRNWIDSVDVITARPQSSATDAWTPRTVNLNAFAGKKIKVRFKGQKLDVGTVTGDIAIDDVVIYEPSPTDVEFIKFLGPVSDCNLNDKSVVTVQFYNFGFGTIPADSLILTTVVNELRGTALPDTLRDTIPFAILAGDTVDFSFTQTVDIPNNAKQYEFKVYSTLNSDSNFGNDTLEEYRVANYTQKPGYVEKFESLDFLDGSCLNAFDDFISKGWFTSGGAYTWNAQNARTCVGPNGATPSMRTGPFGDKTKAEGKFMYTEATLGLLGDVAELTSPCIDFEGETGAAVAFWYHMFGDGTDTLFVDVLADGRWNNDVDRIAGQQQLSSDDGWRVKGVNLGQFAGKKIQVRFRAKKLGETGDISIDEVEFFTPIRQDARVSQVLAPFTQCSPPGTVKIAVENFGTDSILPNTVEVSFRATGGSVFTEILPVGIGVGDSVHYTFVSLGNFERVNTTYNFLSWTNLANDSNTFNDTTFHRFTNITQSIAYKEDFEGFEDAGCGNVAGDLFIRGWFSFPDQFAAPAEPAWMVQTAPCGGTPQGGGPQADATFSNGKYLYLRTAGTDQMAVMKNQASLFSPCIDFTNDTSAGAVFEYHIRGNGNAKLYVDVINDTGYVWAVDSVVGRQQSFASDDWIEKSVKLDEFAGQEIIVILRGISPTNEVIAIDDFSLYIPQPNDARVNKVVAPTSGCELFEESIVAVEIENYGTAVIDKDSLMIYYQVDNRAPVGELAYNETVKYDSVINGVDSFVYVVAENVNLDTKYTHVFAQTADLSESGRGYNIKSWTSLKGEQNVSNDTLFTYVIFNETKRTNYFEDFETFKDAGCTNAVGQVLDNGWIIYGTGNYSWNVQKGLCGKGDAVTNTKLTGPNGDRTLGRDGTFLYTEASTHGDVDAPTSGTTYFQSSCIDLAPNTNIHLSYYYYRYGVSPTGAKVMGDLSTEVFLDSNNYDEATFSEVKATLGKYKIDSSKYFVGPILPADSAKKIDSILNTYFNRWYTEGNVIKGITQTAADLNWRLNIVDLSAYAGQRILLRFRAASAGSIFGDIAIDDIYFYEPTTVDVGVDAIIQPDLDNCSVGERNVIVRVRNFGLEDIAAGTVAMQYIIRGDIVRDTIDQKIDSGGSILFTFKQRVDLRKYSGVQILKVIAGLTGDSLRDNNSAFIEVVNRQPGFPRWFTDFENHEMGQIGGQAYTTDNVQGWKRSPANGGAGTFMWHVQCGAGPYIGGQPPAPPAPPTGPSGDFTYSNTVRNGDGCYLLLESDIKGAPFGGPADATIELPCGDIDFTKTANGKVLLSFYYHMYGNGGTGVPFGMGNLFVDVWNGVQWFNGFGGGIRNAQQFDDTERWQRYEISLDSFATSSNNDMRLRFRAEWSGRSSDMAIDNVEILDRAKKDVRLDRITEPTTGCDLTNVEGFTVRFQNVGTEDILETRMEYQITYTPLKSVGGPTIVGPIVRDTAAGALGFAAPLSFQSFEFDEIDMSAPGTYVIKVWPDVDGDVNYFNDTIVETIVNETRPFNSCEDFSDMVFGQAGSQFRRGKFPNNWTGNTGGYTFKPSRLDGGPTSGHTGRNNDAYLLTNDAEVPPPGNATMESPCFDLTNADAAILEFWYQAPNPNHYMTIEVAQGAAGGQFIEIDTIQGQGLFGVQTWKKATIVLSEYIGDFVRIRFNATHMGSGYYAIDDFCIKSPPPQEIQLEQIINPRRGLCFYSKEEQITVRVQNVGLDRITDFKVVVTVDSAFQNFPAGQYYRDTFEVNVNQNPFFDPGVKMDVNVPALVDLNTINTRYWLNAYVLLDRDTDPTNDVFENYPIDHVVPVNLPYIEDFELVKGELGPNYTNGITAFNSIFYNWSVLTTNSEVGPGFPSNLTGPEADHTFGDKRGTFIMSNSPGQAGETIALLTRCVDLQGTISPEMRYYYYRFGRDVDAFFLQINDDSGWRNIDSLFSEDQRRFNVEWKSRIVDLKEYKGKVVKFRFISVAGASTLTSMALDDISVYDQAARDLAAVSLAKPTTDTLSCYTLEQEVIVNLKNNGSDSIDFSVDTTKIQVVIQKSADSMNWVAIDTLYKCVDRNEFIILDPSSPDYLDTLDLPRDSIVRITMDGTFDMTDTGMYYRFITDIDLKGDAFTKNDRFISDVKSQILGGQARILIDPTFDTICFGENVRLYVKDFFGKPSWESKQIRPDGSGDWFPGIFRPVDEVIYTPAPDTTTEYRVRMCGLERVSADPNFQIFSEPVKIEVVKPSAPTPINFEYCALDSASQNPNNNPQAPAEFRIIDGEPIFLGIPILYEAAIQDFVFTVHAYDSIFHTIKGREFFPAPDGYFKLTNNFDINDGIVNDTVFRTLQFDTIRGNDTAFLQSMVLTPNVKAGRCYSVDKSMFVSDLRLPPIPDFENGADTICGDSAVLLDAGKVPYLTPDENGNVRFYYATYAWSITMPDGTVYDSSSSTPDTLGLINQTFVVDAARLELGKTYTYTVEIVSDGCPEQTIYRTRSIFISEDAKCFISINEVELKDNFSIYPNPVSEKLFISYRATESLSGSIRLISLEGQEIKVYENVNFNNLNEDIDMSDLAKGIYFLKIETEKGTIVDKIIKQ